jgi:hypothetical protein
MKIFQLLLEIVHACSLFHKKGDILVFDSTDILLPSWLSGKVLAQMLYGRDFGSHSVGFLTPLCVFNSLIKNVKNFHLLLEKKHVNNSTLWEEIPFTFHVTAGNCSILLGQCAKVSVPKKLLKNRFKRIKDILDIILQALT